MKINNKRIHICYLSDAPSVHTQRWAYTFAGLGHKVSVISFRPSEIEGVNVIHVGGDKPLTAVNYLFQAPKIRNIINNLDIDILHAHYCTSYGFIGALSTKHPLVVTTWGSDILVSPEKSILYRLLVRWVLHQADLVTSMADHMTRQILLRNYANPLKLITLPFGVDTNEFNPSYRQNNKGRMGLLVLSTRRLDKICDISTFIKAVPIVLKKVPEVKFIVASDGPLREELEAMVTQSNLSETIVFAGWIPQNDLPILLANADIVVSTAISDGNNISLNEAMACGAFPIATDIPANREWLNDGENGLLFPPGDAEALATKIVIALQNPKLRIRAAQLNWEIIQKRASWELFTKIMEQHYFDLIHSNNDK